MLVSWDQNADRNREIKIGIRSFENVSQFKYLGTTVTNQNLIQEESSETSFLTRATWRNILEDTILHSHRRESLKSYTILHSHRRENLRSYFMTIVVSIISDACAES
jgi:hypothetical protein